MNAWSLGVSALLFAGGAGGLTGYALWWGSRQRARRRQAEAERDQALAALATYRTWATQPGHLRLAFPPASDQEL